MKLIKIITLMAVAALLAACTMLNEPGKAAPGGNGELVPVRVTIGGNARTILPDIGAGFSKYVLTVAPGLGNDQDAPEPVERSAVEYYEYFYIEISLLTGNWIFTVTAYVNVDGTDYPVSSGSASLNVGGDDGGYNISIAINAPETGTGTFGYTVTYPSSADTASLKLAPIGDIATPVINVTSVINGGMADASIASGVYFLTVSATKDGKTVTRNEVVHIYPYLVTNANYVFTKLDFGDDYLQLGGTINVLIDGNQPTDSVYIQVLSDKGDSLNYIYFYFNDGNIVPWSLNFDNLHGANAIIFRMSAFDIRVEISIPVPVDDATDIELVFPFSTDSFSATQLTANTWTDGSVSGTTSYSTEVWYSVNVTEGTTYYFWMNNAWEGDGTQTAGTYITVYDNNGRDLFGDTSQAWYFPVAYTANANGTIYIKLTVYSWNNINTCAIAYSTDSNWNNALDAIAIELNADTWIEGSVPRNTGNTETWYYINVTEGTTYYFWSNDANEGDGTKTAWTSIAGYYAGNYIFYINNIWHTPWLFIAAASGKLYLRVQAWGDWETETEDTYAIKYNTTGIRD